MSVDLKQLWLRKRNTNHYSVDSSDGEDGVDGVVPIVRIDS